MKAQVMPSLNWLDSKVREGLNPKRGAPWWCDTVVNRKKVVYEGDIWFVLTFSSGWQQWNLGKL